jgi:RNA-directed DNA polymerase
VDAARRILKQLGVELHPQKTRIVHVRYGFEFLGYKIKRGYKKLHLPESKIRSQARQDALYAYPKEKSIRRFMEQVRQRTKRTMPWKTKELIEELNPLLRGWGEYYKRAHIRKLSNVSTAGSGGASGRIAISISAMLAGNGCLWSSFTASTSLFVCST